VGPWTEKFDSDVLERLCGEDELTLVEIADKLGSKPDRIREMMERHGIDRRQRGGRPKYPQLRRLAVGESIELPKSERKKPHLSFYDMARKAGIRVSVKRVDETTYRSHGWHGINGNNHEPRDFK